MKVKVQVVIEGENSTVKTSKEVFSFKREGFLPETLGLTLSEGKQVLAKIQEDLVTYQAEEYIRQQNNCSLCGKKHSHNGKNNITYRTLFGKLNIESPRLYTCPCQVHTKKSFSPLAEMLPERTSPELLYLETKWSSLMSFGMSVDLLEEVLPLQTNIETVILNSRKVAERIESELGEEKYMYIDGCENEWNSLPHPESPITVGIDGGYVHARDGENRKAGWFEVIVGKSMQEGSDSKRFGFVNNYDKKPKRRLYEMLQRQGLQYNQEITFLSDGGDTVRDLQRFMSPNAEHILDWFHVTMRITVMKQMAKGLSSVEHLEGAGEELERVKWYLWHGNVFRALQVMEDIAEKVEMYLYDEEMPANQKVNKLEKAVAEFMTYIKNNEGFIPNYSDRHHYGDVISSAFVESTVNEVVSRRMAKKQQMRWTKEGAHLMLQVRTQTLNNDLRNTFHRWYPGMSRIESPGESSNRELEQCHLN